MSDDGAKRKSTKLGRGLSALLGEEDDDQAQLERLRQSRTLPTERLTPGPFQPRRRFDSEDLSELAESVREQGILQPILVRRDPDDETYQIVAGERRWRAAQLAQLHEVPVLIREFDDRTAMEIALVENVQRRDLSPLEEADGYRRLIDEFAHSQEELARAVGKSRSHVANTMRLLNLPDDVRALLEDGQLTAGHARALLGIEGASALAREVVTRKLNVRETERLVQRAKAGGPVEGESAGPTKKDADTRILEEDLSERTGLRVSVSHNPRTGAGSVVLRYRDLDQLDLIVDRLSTTRLRSESIEPSLGSPSEPAAAAHDDLGAEAPMTEDLDPQVPHDVDLPVAESPMSEEREPDPLEPVVVESEALEAEADPDPEPVPEEPAGAVDDDPESGASEDRTEEPAAEPAADAPVDPAEIRWDFDDDEDPDDPLVPKEG